MENTQILQGITFSEYAPEDHQGFVDCINTFYEGGYPYQPYLEKDVLAKHIADGDMIITVAKNSEGRIVGTSAARYLDGAFSNSVLLLLRCVATDYRRRGIGKAQEQYLFELIDRRFPNAESIYADVMTHDIISQSTVCKNGFVLCGYRMMLYKNDIICPTITFAPGTKMTQAIYCKARVHKNVNLYVPEEYREVIGGIYEKLGISCSFSEEARDLSSLEYTFRNNPLHQASELHVTHSGSRHISYMLNCAEGTVAEGNTSVVYVNMNQCGCPAVIRSLQTMGYVFSGIKPLSSCGEYFVMSNIKNCVHNFEDIKYPESEEKLSGYIFGGFAE